MTVVNLTKTLVKEAVAGKKIVTFPLRKSTLASYTVKSSCCTPCCATTFTDCDITLSYDTITVPCHGLYTGLKGALSIACYCTSVFDDCCICICCDTITETGHGLTLGTSGVLSFTKGTAKAFPDECVCLTCNCITETGHGYVEGERGQFSFTIGCSFTFDDCDVCLCPNDTITKAAHGLTAGERVQLTIANGTACTFSDGDICLTCDCITICSHGWITGQRVNLTMACTANFNANDGDVSLACDTITEPCHGLPAGARVQLTHAAGCAGTFRDGDVCVCCNTITISCHGLVTGSKAQYTITNVTCAKNFLEANITLACNQVTICAHGLTTGQKGQLTTSIGSAINTLEGDITFACNTIDEPCIALIEDQRVQLTICNGCASTILDECICITCDCFTDAGHGLLVNQRGQFTVTIGCPVACIQQGGCCSDICLTCDTFTATAHGLTDLERGQVTSTCALPAGLCACTNYFVIKVDCNTFSLATTRANAVCNTAINITGAGSGQMTFTPNGALPSGLCLSTNYYLICVTCCTYKVSASQGGAAVNMTALNGPASTIFTPNGILPAALTACCCYFLTCVVTGACGSFKVAATSGGAAICLVDNNGGVGTFTWTPNGILPTGVTTCTDYYIIKVDCNNIKFASTQANAVACTAICLTAKNGGGTMTFTGNGAVVTGLSACCNYFVIRCDVNTIQLATTICNALCGTQIDLTGVGGAALNTLTPNGGVPTGLSACTNYFITCPTATTFQLATSEANALAGTQIDLTALNGSTTMTFNANGAVPTGVCACTNYFVIKSDCNTIQLATTQANAVCGCQINLTAINGADTMTLTPNGTVPTGLCACTNYFVIDASCCTIKLATTRANALACTAINLTAINGAGTMTITPNGALPTGLSACTNYYVIKDDCNTYRVATSRANAVACAPTAVCLTALNAPATQTFTPNGDVPTGLCGCCITYYVTDVTANTYKLASTLANAQAGTEIDLTALNGAATITFNPNATFPTGLSATTYYIIRCDANTFKLASSKCNAIAAPAVPVDITALNGSSTLSFTPCSCPAAVVSWRGSNDGCCWFTIPCGPANICLTCVASSTMRVESCISYNYAEVTVCVTKGQFCIEIEGVGKSSN